MTSLDPLDTAAPDRNAEPPIDIALAMPPGSLRDASLYALRGLNAHIALDREDASNWDGLAAAMEQAGIHVLLFDLLSADEAVLTKSIAAIRARIPHARLIAAYPYDDPAKILMAMRTGANEFVHSPVGPALTAAFKRIAPYRPCAAPERRGRVVGFVSAKGGCGATTVACHIAADLKWRTRKEVLLAEFDTSAGPLAFLMKTQGPYSMGDALDSSTRLDANLWAALVAQSRTGVFVLPAPARLTEGDCQADRVLRVIRFMRTQHDWLVLDFGRGLNPLLAAVADELDELFLITTIGLPSLHMAKQMLRTLPGAFDNVPVRLVLNRTQKALDISIDEIRTIFARPVHAVIPDDFSALYEAYANGGLAGPETAMGKCFARMAMQLTGEPEPPKKKRFGLW